MLRKMDEMEIALNLSAIKWSWAYAVAVLAIWSVADFVRLGTLTLPAYLLITQNLIYFFALHIGKWRAGDESGKRAILWYLTAALAILLATGAAFLYYVGI